MSQTPAGWYDDPEQPGRLRYWDGAAWTEHRHDPTSASSEPSVGAAGPSADPGTSSWAPPATTGAAGGSWGGDAGGAGSSPWSSPAGGHPASSSYGGSGPTTGTGSRAGGSSVTASSARGASGGRRYGLGAVLGAAAVALVIGLGGGFAIGWVAGGVDELVDAGIEFTENGAFEETAFEPVPGTFTADGWQFDSVMLRRDGFGDFEVEADVTNTTGGVVSEVVWVVQVLDAGGNVLGTLDVSSENFPAGTTRRMTFIGVDDYQSSWSTVAFEVLSSS